MAKGKCVLSLNDAGIANRIKNILSVLRLGRVLARTPILYWCNNAFARCEFGDLFGNPLRVIHDEAQLKKILRDNQWQVYQDVNNKLMRTQCDYILVRTWRLLTLPNEIPNGFAVRVPSVKGNDIDFEFDRIPEAIREDYVALINTLRPIDYIVQQTEAVSRRFCDSTVSVSVRSWVESKERARYFNIQDYFDIMDRMNDATFFMSCDSPAVLDQFSRRYRGRVMYYQHRTSMGDRNSKEGMQDILIDLYLLAKNARLIASFRSTYSEMAWWFGGCRAKVELVGINQMHRRGLLMRDLRDRASLLCINLLYRRYLQMKMLMGELACSLNR